MKSIDIVFPENNEKKLIEIAKAFGTKELVFVYHPQDYKEYKNNEKGITIKTAVISAPKEVRDAMKKWQYVVVQSNKETDRWVMEHAKPWLMYGFENDEKKDFMHHRNSGIDHILAKIMKENKIIYGFSVSQLIHADSVKRALLLGRLQQNLMLAKKYSIIMILASFSSDPMDMRNWKDVECLLQ